MSLLCMSWGLQQVLQKAAAEDIHPLLQTASRSALAGILLFVLMRARGESLDRRLWRPGIKVGLLFACEYLLVGEALCHTTAGHVVVFLNTAPLFVALGLHLRVRGEHMDLRQWAGIGLAFVGIAWAFFHADPTASPTAIAGSLFGDTLALCAGVCSACATVTVRGSALGRAAPTQALLWQLGGSVLVQVPAAFALGQVQFHITPLALSSLLFQGIVVAFASYLGWFWLLRRHLASRLNAMTLLSPVFGVMFGVLLLGEPVGIGFASGALLVLGGIALTSMPLRVPRPHPVAYRRRTPSPFPARAMHGAQDRGVNSLRAAIPPRQPAEMPHRI